VEVAHSARVELPCKISKRASVAADQPARLGLIVEAVEDLRHSSPQLAPQAAANFLVCAKLVTGRMPGTIGACDPPRRTRSRNRKNVSGERRNWVSAAGSPPPRIEHFASSSRVTRQDWPASGCNFGISRHRNLERPIAPQARDQICGIA
jgi:hypothetical protein